MGWDTFLDIDAFCSVVLQEAEFITINDPNKSHSSLPFCHCSGHFCFPTFPPFISKLLFLLYTLGWASALHANSDVIYKTIRPSVVSLTTFSILVTLYVHLNCSIEISPVLSPPICCQ